MDENLERELQALNPTAVVRGEEHVVALLADGTVRCWGSGNYGNNALPPDLRDVTAIAAGEYHSIALRSDGTTACWGYKHSIPSPKDIAGLPKIKHVAASGGATFAIGTDGSMLAWGAGATSAPPWAKTPRGFVARGFVAFVDGGGARVMRADLRRRIEDDAAHIRRTILAKTALSEWSRLQPASINAVRGFVAHWGPQLRGELCVIMQARPASCVRGLASGTHHGLLCLEDGQCIAWGASDAGQARVPRDARSIEAVAAGGQWSAARDGVHRTWLWGQGCPGLPWTPANLEELLIQQLPHDGLALEFADWLQAKAEGIGVRCVRNHADAIAIMPSGTLLAWGKNVKSKDRRALAAIGPAAEIAVGGTWMAARLRDGKTVVLGKECDHLPWADEAGVEFATPDEERPLTRAYLGKLLGASVVPTKGPSGIEVLVGADGSLRCLGANPYRACKVPSDLGPVATAAVGNNHVIALLRDGTVRCWGYNLYNQCNVPAGLAGVADVFAGRNHSIALMKDGSLRSWGGTDPTVSAVPQGIAPPVRRIQPMDRLTWCIDCNGDAHIWGVMSDLRALPFELDEEAMLRFAARYGEHLRPSAFPEPIRKHPQFKAMRALWRMRRGK